MLQVQALNGSFKYPKIEYQGQHKHWEIESALGLKPITKAIAGKPNMGKRIKVYPSQVFGKVSGGLQVGLSLKKLPV